MCVFCLLLGATKKTNTDLHFRPAAALQPHSVRGISQAVCLKMSFSIYRLNFCLVITYVYLVSKLSATECPTHPTETFAVFFIVQDTRTFHLYHLKFCCTEKFNCLSKSTHSIKNINIFLLKLLSFICL